MEIKAVGREEVEKGRNENEPLKLSTSLSPPVRAMVPVKIAQKLTLRI